MSRHLPSGSEFFLIAGSYSGLAKATFTNNGVSIVRTAMRFRSFPGQERSYDGVQELNMGTMDPSAFQTPDNRLLLGVIHTDGRHIPIVMWSPDGDCGQYTVEQTYFYLEPWLVNEGQKRMQIGQIVGVTAAATAASVLPFGFLLRKKIQSNFVKKVHQQDQNYDRLDTITTPRLMRDFGAWLMENGLFSQAFMQYAASLVNSTDRL
jgi:hypothetical protein